MRIAITVVLVSLSACSQKPSSLVNVTSEATGVNCPSGGIRIETGVDTNGDGTLTPDEVTSTRFVCNGETGAAGPKGTTGETGEMGETGETGANGNPGPRGHNTLVNVSAEPAGANCVSGGERIDSGLDLDDNGTLAASEITITNFVCDDTVANHIFFGDVTIYSQSDVSQLNGFDVVVGNVNVIADSTITLPSIKQISGALQITGNSTFVSAAQLQTVSNVSSYSANLTTLALPALSRATIINLSLSKLTTLSLPALTNATDVTVSQNSLLTQISLPVLTRSHDLNVLQNPILNTVFAPLLNVSGTINVAQNPSLATLSLPSLNKADNVSIVLNPLLVSVALPVLLNTKNLEINGNATLGSLTLTTLGLATSIIIRDNDSLVTLALPALENVTTFIIDSNDALASISANALATAEDFNIYANPDLTALSVNALTSSSSINVTDHATTQLSFPELTGVAGYFRIGNAPSLQTISLPVATRIDSIVLFNVPLDLCAFLHVLNAGPTVVGSLNPGGSLSACTASDLCHSLGSFGTVAHLTSCLAPSDFSNAETRCSQLGTGAHLAWFESAAEWNVVSTAVQTYRVPAGFIGYSDSATPGSFTALSGFNTYNPTTDSALDFFEAGQPSGSGGLSVARSGLVSVASGVTPTALCRVP